MAVSDDKDRIIVTVSKELKKKLKKLADIDNRNLSNYCANELEKIVKNK